MKIFSPVLKGTTVSDGTSNLSGSFTGSLSGTATTASNANTASYVVSSQTDETQNTRLQTLESVTGSYASTSSLATSNARITTIEAVTGSFTLTSSFGAYTSSNDTTNTTQNARLLSNEQKTGSFATTGSNFFIGNQVITGSVYIANDLIVQGSSSLQNITASAVSIGTNTVILNTDSPAVRFAGISVRDSGSNSSVTSSIWYDSLNNKWIYQNESGSSYSGGMFISGPRNTGSLGSEAGMDSGYITKGLGGDHIGPSVIFESGSTNIGIGTTSPASLLDVAGDARFGDGNNFNPLIQFAGSGRVQTSPGYSFVGDLDTGMFNPNTGNTLAFTTGGSERIRINSSGNVGIGTTSPNVRLDVGYVAGAVAFRIERDINNRLDFYQGDGVSYIDSSPASAQLAFSTVGTERMRITTAGELLIGTTTDSGDYKLQVNGNEYIKLTQGAVQTWSNSGNSSINIRTNTGYNSILAFTEEGVSDRWSIGTKSADSNLYFSTGDALGSVKLTLSSAGAATFSSNITATGTVRSINGGVDATFVDAFIGVYSGNNNEQNAIQTAVSSIAASSGFRFQASDGGGSTGRTNVVDFRRDRALFYTNVGIGTTNPSYKLEVNGTTTTDFRIVDSGDVGFQMTSGGTSNAFSIRTNGSTVVLSSANSRPLTIGVNSSTGDVLSSTTGLSIVSGGAATFASTVTTNDVLYVGTGGTGATITWGSSISYIYSPGAKALSLSVGGTPTNGIYITTSGNIGIGISSPGKILTVNGAVAGEIVQFNNTRNTSGDYVIVTNLGASINNTNAYHYIAVTGGADRLYIYGNGNVVNQNGSYGTLSDVTLKENIIDATPKLDDILQLKVRNFNLIGDSNKQIGFIAQEFEEVFPSMIDIDGKSGKKAIKTSVLVPMLVKSIQELKAEVDTLRAQISQ